ncbi:hypothetical protein G6L37_34830 [Agrobacterium rubi]|nr:hypothetical protein [Agrobacterium rubi]NTF23744.1 hypothetical protein [Agrobacterium rubi]
MNTADLPTVLIPEVAHVGSLDVSRQKSGSYEGRCLSVSQVPSSWARIARLGDSGFILSGRGCFIDALELTESQRTDVIDWAVTEGLLELRQIVRLHIFDCETELWDYSDFPSMEMAMGETEFLEEEDFRMEEMPAHIATVELAIPAGHDLKHMDSSMSFDLALIEFASRDAAIDGIWWNEHYDPSSLSAPRGGIFPDRIASFDVRSADWEALEEFEERFTSMDLEPYMADAM